jgi:hypothetical protein
MGIMNGQTWINAFIPLPGGSTMMKLQIPGTVFAYVRHANHVSTVSVESTLNGRTANSDKAFAPFGEVYNIGAAGNGDTDFAGLSPDTVAGYTMRCVGNTARSRVAGFHRIQMGCKPRTPKTRSPGTDIPTP